ncbi:astacin-like metalloprotease toxin 5 [Eriocheir sinensis]|uniref:astacin-like metalloprotease toxin 5 n=1 Tax=Eriocheir sinensis TaxID=95602 RepID=UPI0021C81D13|nr:astacin-like metalloprotease toxin 5 [Eriocheir sinensis]
MAVRDNHRLWPGGQLLYRLDFDTTSNTYVKDVVESAMKQINAVGCVAIEVASASATDYISVQLGNDYSSYMGRQGGPQNMTVVAKTINRGTVMHELMHSLGLGHEHNRPDRDEYVTVDFDNIQDAAKPYFTKYTPNDPLEEDHLEYDYTSLMHATNVYDEEINIDIMKPVIWRNDGGIELGQRSYLTELDQQRLKMIYSCDVCKSNQAGSLLFRYPGDCSRFIQCSNAQAYIMDCPQGLHFNNKKQICDYPDQAECTTQSA